MPRQERDFEREAKVIALFNTGKSYSEIAAIMGDNTRNSIASVIARARARGDTSLTRAVDSGKAHKLDKAELRTPGKARTIHRPPLPIVKQVADDPVGGFTLLQLRPRACKWPLARDGAETLFCGATVTDPLWPYCAFHQRRSIGRAAS